MPTPPLVLVAGGTSGTGRLVVERLHRDGVSVRVLARSPVGAAALFGAGVEIAPGDITKPATLPAAVQGAHHIVFTAGVRSGQLAGEELVKATDYQGAVDTIAAAREAGLAGRFVYMTSMGVKTWSLSAVLLNTIKGKTLAWRLRVEDEIRRSGLDYAIVRPGFLMNGPAGTRPLAVGQSDWPLAPRYRIARADVADALVEALTHPRASRATFDIAWRRDGGQDWHAMFNRLRPDAR